MKSPLHKVAVVLAVAALSGVGLTACDDEYDDEPAAAQPAAATSGQAAAPAVAWGACPAPAPGAPARDARQTCGTIDVPLDYRNPGGQTISVAVSRLSTAAPGGEQRPVLVLNPGGPGLPGLDTPSEMAPTLPADLLQRYDLIGFDPRGVQHSTPQSCGLPDPNVSGMFPYPAADGSITANTELAKATAQQCATTAGENLKFFTTANTARDLDRLRQALGVEKISYWGQSYGTYLGTVYATLFQDRTDRMILEGNVDPGKVWAAQIGTWGKGMSERFPDAAAVAAAQNGTLGLGASTEAVTATYLELADRLDRTPAAVPGTQAALTGAMLRNVTYGLLLHNENLPVVAQVWKAAADLADGTLTDADKQVVAQIMAPAPEVPGVPVDNQATMFLALQCGDVAWSHDVDAYAAAVAADRKAWPLTAGMPANVWACAFWNTEPIEAPVTVSDQGARNILVLQNLRDNATPWDAAVGLRTALGNRAALVGVDNGGHYVYHAGSACADKAAVDLLTSGTLPAADVRCTDVRK